MNDSLGRTGTLLHTAKLTCLHVLAVANCELERRDILDRGWPEIFPQRDDFGYLSCKDSEFAEKMAVRKNWMRIERDVSVALRDLRARGLARSHGTRGGGRALRWEITDEGHAWRHREFEDFKTSVMADIAAL